MAGLIAPIGEVLGDKLDTVRCADALTFLGELPEGSIDMILTSPPYDNLRTYNGCSWNFEGIARQMYRVLKPGGVAVWIVGDSVVDGSETLSSFKQALYFKECVGFRLHDTMIWRKVIPGDMGKRYNHAFEYMFILSKADLLTFNALMKPNKKSGTVNRKDRRKVFGNVSSDGYRIVNEYGRLENVWDIQSGNTGSDITKHSAAFPEELARRHILTWSNPGQVVLDPFMGSGTTAKIARNLDRHYVGCDISPEYVALAVQRLQNSDPFLPKMLPNGTKQLSLFEVAS